VQSSCIKGLKDWIRMQILEFLLARIDCYSSCLGVINKLHLMYLSKRRVNQTLDVDDAY
jgi:hypothetical protein